MRIAFVPAILLCLGSTAAAQTNLPRWSVSVNGGVQSGAAGTSDHFEFQQDLEPAKVDVRYDGKLDALVDVGAGVRLYRNLGAGVAITHYSHDGSAAIEATIPHPFFFNRPRAIEGDAGGVTRSETATHVQVLYGVNLSSRVRLMLSGGPSVFSVEQALVSEVKYDEAFPYDTATFRTATTRASKASGAGFNVGADVAWMFQQHLGIGAFVRGTRGRVTLDTSDKRRIKVDAGGVQGGAGLRLVF